MYFAARRRGTSFERTITLGHQRLYLYRREVKDLRRRYQEGFGKWPTSLAAYEWGDYADGFLREFLGISSLAVVDASEYEGADIIHDMNHAVPAEWYNQYDVVIDSGSLEHIFNVPVALKNLANILKVGGTMFITTPANNLMGHGFYQFSPELMFRVFSEKNGFTVRSLSLFEAGYPSVELTRNRKVYEVTDPQQVHQRVGLMSKRPAMMMVEAVKAADMDMFATPPMQSDYVAAWSSTDAPPQRSSLRKAVRGVLNTLPEAVSAQVSGRRQRRAFSLRNTKFYTRKRTHNEASMSAIRKPL